MLLAEDLLLLVTYDASGRLSVPAAAADAGLGGANLLELALMNKVGLSGEHDASKPGRVIVWDPAPTGDPVLDAALSVVVAHQGCKPATLIRPLGEQNKEITRPYIQAAAAHERSAVAPLPSRTRAIESH